MRNYMSMYIGEGSTTESATFKEKTLEQADRFAKRLLEEVSRGKGDPIDWVRVLGEIIVLTTRRAIYGFQGRWGNRTKRRHCPHSITYRGLVKYSVKSP